MLENTGATVLPPCERGWQITKITVDNDGYRDGHSVHTEQNNSKVWSNGTKIGFTHLRATCKDFENPFCEGSYCQTEMIEKGAASIAEWILVVPWSGRYAVYVSYKTTDNSTNDALYTVYHQSGTSQFKVNQRIGGGTWTCLGILGFSAGKTDHEVVPNNQPPKAGRLMTADTARIGGGCGSITHSISEGRGVDYPYEISSYPRFCEIACYWMQWAGIPDSVCSDSHGKNDYTDDYKPRGAQVSYLAGGSTANPTEKGLNILIDVAPAFHSDADTTYGDTVTGTLGIF